MDATQQARDFTRFVEALPSDERGAHIDVLYERWRETALAEEDLAAVQESLEDFRNGERGRDHAETLASLRRGLADEFGP